MSYAPRRRVADRSGRSAFTLVELLVVIAIIGILIALLLPAVQAAREAARRSQCTNNLKQLALAMHNYHDTFKCLPPSAICYSNGTTGDNPPYDQATWGWATFILPYVEEKPLYDALDPSTFRLTEVLASGNAPLLQTPIEAFVCPSGKSNPTNEWRTRTAPTNTNPSTAPAGFDLELGTSNYLANTGGPISSPDTSGAGCGGLAPTGWNDRWSTGGVREQRHITFGDITDGTSNTIACGERGDRCHGGVWPGSGGRTGILGDDPYVGGAGPRIDQFAANDGTCGIQMNGGITLASDFSDHPNRFHNSCEGGYSSEHPDGAVFALLDGSGRFISDLIEFREVTGWCGDARNNNAHADDVPTAANPLNLLGVYQMLGMRDDGDPIPKDF